MTTPRIGVVALLVATLTACQGVDEASRQEREQTQPETGPSTTIALIVTGPAVVTMATLPSMDYGIYGDVILRGGRVTRGSIEYANFRATCFAQEFGIPLTVVGPGSTRYDGPPLPAGLFEEAFEECERRAVESGLIGYTSTDLPDEETLRLWYRAYVEVAYECLNELGYPTTPPPSMDVWVEGYPDVWYPHDEVGTEAESMEGACSQDIVDLLIELGRRDEADPTGN